MNYINQYLKLDWRTAKGRPIRDGVGEGLILIGEDERVVVLSGDVAESTRIADFGERWPNRFFEMGVQEQNIAGVAGGMASEGLIPIVSSYAAFSPGRNWEQIRVSICMPNLNVMIIGGHGGVATGKNGPTHQATEDIALMRVLPKMTVLVPADAGQGRAAIVAAYKLPGPVYIRTARPETPDFTKVGEFEVGKTYKYRDGRDVTLASCGVMVWVCLQIAEDLASVGIECEVLNVSTVKPLDRETIGESARKTGRVVTVEDHQEAGGMGGAVAELLAEKCPVPIKRIGVPDRFGMSGDWQEVYEELGISREKLREAIRRFVLD